MNNCGYCAVKQEEIERLTQDASVQFERRIAAELRADRAEQEIAMLRQALEAAEPFLHSGVDRGPAIKEWDEMMTVLRQLRKTF